jgi:tetratricopeptide (TPR) repeat protein
MAFDELFRGFTDLIYNGCLPSMRHDLLAGELIKARLLKASKRFDEALASVNSTLLKQPDYPETLFLKAQILWEGFSRHAAAAACLKKVAHMQPMQNEKDENIRRWSESLLKEMAQQRQTQRR